MKVVVDLTVFADAWRDWMMDFARDHGMRIVTNDEDPSGNAIYGADTKHLSSPWIPMNAARHRLFRVMRACTIAGVELYEQEAEAPHDAPLTEEEMQRVSEALKAVGDHVLAVKLDKMRLLDG